jgi:hypothetical protein
MAFFRKLFSIGKSNIYLGRWNLKYDDSIINRVVRMANEDHCGCCHIKYNSEEEKYYLPFVYSILE